MYKLSQKSMGELIGVDNSLVDVVCRAILVTEQDFTVHDGIRTFEQQKKLVASGASTTMNSKHLKGQAVDLVPYVNGKLRWEWPLIFKIAEAMRTAAKIKNIRIKWGGAWDIVINDTDMEKSMEQICTEYSERRRKAGKRIFLDGHHFELA